jgi:hypothetical protein
MNFTYCSNKLFLITNGLNQGDALLLLLFNVALEYVIRMVRANLEALKLNCTHNCACDVYILVGSIHTINKNTEDL